MAVVSFFLACFVLSHLLLHFVSAEKTNETQMSCRMLFDCGEFGPVAFPFSNTTYPQCGLCIVNCDHHPFPQVQLRNEGPWFDIKGIDHDIILSHNDKSVHTEVEIHDQVLQSHLDNKNCHAFSNLTFANSPSISFAIPNNLTFFKCNKSCKPDSDRALELFQKFHRDTCEGFQLFYKLQDHHEFSPSHLQQCCSVVQLPMNQSKYINLSTNNPFELLTATFSLQLHVSEDCVACQHSGGQCQNHNQTFRCQKMPKEKGTHTNNKAKLRLILATGIASIVMVITIILLSFFRRKIKTFWKFRTEDDKNVETFLKNFGSLVPQRYSYLEVKKIANGFKDKLGEGGYGSVFKGKLKNGQFVAVKLLKESKGNGEEFVNEVASISRTSHVNVVTLLGFCYEGHKRALIYEFMPNGSLEKFIYKRSSLMTEHQLGWETLYRISVGIARGLEYLHLGCNTRILHFDIKPHNILLDQDLCPKISDFGLSKLCLNKESTISRVSTRGTVGYIAPEVFCRNFGVVSSKSDVYSYGMMILEMVGEREDIDSRVDHTSELYFPEMIYKHLELDEKIGLHGITNEVGNEKRKKMIIVGLWCIQTDPSNRPSMSRVVEMLEGSMESLQIPPKPFLFSPPRAPNDPLTMNNVTSGSNYSVPSLK